METHYTDGFWHSSDGLKLHFRDYPARHQPGDATGKARPPIVCLPGLTRNARDFAHVAERLSEVWRVICIDNRGRGDSEFAPDPMTYTPPHYVGDLLVLLEQEGIERFVAIGTSLGGLMTMMIAARTPDKLAAAIINDIGPEIDPGGIERIKEYVGKQRSFETWMHAAQALAETGSAAFPHYQTEDWLRMAKRSMAVGSNGRISFDYDMKIAEPFAVSGNAAPPDLWPAYAALGQIPLLVLRGELSDLLSEYTVSEMRRHTPDAKIVTVPGVGHAPMLDEPVAIAAIDSLLERVS